MADGILSDYELSGIYQIRNLINGKRYIGSAKCFRVRWYSHKCKLRKGVHHSPHLQASWSKNGPSAFVFEVVEVCETPALIVREQHWLDQEKPEFNVCPTAGSTLGRRHSRATRQKIGARKVGLKLPARSDSYRAAISAAHKGRPKAERHMAALQRGRILRVYTDEQREQISSSLRAAYESGLRSRTKTEQHKQRIGQHYAKLTDDQVREIRRLRASGVTGRSLAKRFGSNPGTISEICSGKRYRWVT